MVSARGTEEYIFNEIRAVHALAKEAKTSPMVLYCLEMALCELATNETNAESAKINTKQLENNE